jgi:hypothetical protein
MYTAEEAYKELQVKTISTIQRDTAATWTNRAIAAYRLFIETGIIDWYLNAEEFRHEALEHAALTEPSMVDSVRLVIAPMKLNATIKLKPNSYGR